MTYTRFNIPAHLSFRFKPIVSRRFSIIFNYQPERYSLYKFVVVNYWKKNGRRKYLTWRGPVVVVVARNRINHRDKRIGHKKQNIPVFRNTYLKQKRVNNEKKKNRYTHVFILDDLARSGDQRSPKDLKNELTTTTRRGQTGIRNLSNSFDKRVKNPITTGW